MHIVRGKVTRQAHVDVPFGLVEEEFGRNGFFGRASHLYRTRPPVEWQSVEGDLAPAALRATELPGLRHKGPWSGARVAFVENADVTLSMAQLETPMRELYRNADGDELIFVHQGAGVLDTDFGPLAYQRGDYLMIPRGVTYSLSPDVASSFLIVESAEAFEIPDRGLLGKHALFDLDTIEAPNPAPHEERGDFEVHVKRAGKMSTIRYPFHPLNVAGWKGDLYPWRLNIRDIRPILSERYHLPPSAHATFITPSAVICTFLPRGLETGDPGAMRVPFYHSNIDFDEVIFYHDGDFFSRAGIKPGMVTFHPQGIHHGPQPEAVRAGRSKERTSEQAVMIDTRRPLSLTAAGAAASIPNYHLSWTNEEDR